MATRLLGLVLPRSEREFVLGDLEEEFYRRATQRGRLRATIWYWGEAARSAWPLLTLTEVGRDGMMMGLDQDLRGAARVFRRSPGFAAVVVATLALGIGGASSVYSVLKGVVLTPLALEESERIVMLWGQSPEYERTPLTVGDYNVLAQEVDGFEAVAAAWSNYALILGEGAAEQVSVGWVTPEYFGLLRIDPLLGRAPQAGEESAVVISNDLWVRRYGADPSVVGRAVDLSGDRFEIIGVLGPDQDPNLSTFAAGRARHEVWRLQPREWTQGDDRSVGWLRATARLADGASLAQVGAEVDALMTRVNETVTDRDGGTELAIHLVPVRIDLFGGVSQTLWVLLAAVLGVLLIAASNVAHLMLGRAEMRGGEVAVRAALGGSRLRLVRQLLVEGGALAAAGGIAGLAVAWWGITGLLALAPPTLPRLELVRLDSGVFVFALLATALTAVVFAVVPALRATRTDLVTVMGDRRTTGDRNRRGISHALVVAQVGLSLTLLTGTGLLLESLNQLAREELGFRTDNIVTFALEAPSWGSSLEESAARMTAYAEALEAVPGVEGAGFTNRIPLAGGLFTGTYVSEEMAAQEAEPAQASFRYVTPGYLATMGARVVDGRDFRSDDGIDVVLIDQTAAERAWPGERAVGKRVRTSVVGEEEGWAEIVGVVAPMKHAGVADDAVHTVFMSMLARAHQMNFRYVAVRVAGEPLGYVEALGDAVRSIDGNAVLARTLTMSELYDAELAPTRFASILLLVFGLVALLLATVGLHGVMAFSIRRRTRELGIRMALGAERAELLRNTLGSGAKLVVAGAGLGVLLSLSTGRLLGSLLFGVRPTDVATLALASTLILAIGLLGAYLPARLVLAMDPARTLREE